MQKKWLIVLVAFALLAIGYCFMFVTQKTTNTNGVTLFIESGTVELKLPNTESWRRAHDGETLVPGTKIKTDATAQAVVIFYNASTAWLKPNTEITLDAFVPRKVSLTLLKGSVWSRVVKLLDLGVFYEVKTSTTVSVVRGTSFSVTREDNAVVIAVTESEVETTIVATGTSYRTSAGNGLRIEDNGTVYEQILPPFTPPSLYDPYVPVNTPPVTSTAPNTLIIPIQNTTGTLTAPTKR